MIADSEKLELEALVARMAAADFGDGDPAAVRALKEHLAANPGIAELHGSVATLWKDLGELQEPNFEPEGEPEQPRWWHHLSYQKVAAVLVPCLIAIGLLAGTGLIGFSKSSSDLSQFEFATAAGERRILSLPDGSTVTLSARSAVGVDLQPRSRRLKLAEGEAVFDVAHDSKRPFIVEAGDGEVMAVGTAFNIRVSNRRVVVTVLEGRVNVSSGVERSGGRTRIAQMANAGEQVVYGSAPLRGAGNSAQSYMEPARSVDAARVAQWSQGLLQFRGEPLSKVVDEVNRHSLRQIRLHDPELAKTPIYGVLHIGDESGLISIVADMTGLGQDALRRKISVDQPADARSIEGD